MKQLFYTITLAILISSPVFSQEKCKYQIDKVDEFTSETIIMTKYKEFAAKMAGIAVVHQCRVATKMIKTASDTTFSLEFEIKQEDYSVNSNAYKINKGDKCIILFANNEKLVLEAKDVQLGKKIPDTVIDGKVLDYTCILDATYQLSKTDIEKLKTFEVAKIRFEVNGGEDWLQKINLDEEVLKSEVGIKFNDQDKIVKQFVCLMSRL